jgi:hypothetical protein
MDGSGWSRGVTKARAEASSLASGLEPIKGAIASAFSIGAIAALTKSTIEYAGHINDIADRIGVTTDYLQEMQYVTKQNGAEVDDLVKIFEKLGDARNKALSGDVGAQNNFKQLGISQEALQTKSRESILDSIAASFKAGNSPAMTAAFKDIGGKGAAVLIPSFVDGIESGRAAARAAGAVISEDVLIQLDEIGDGFDRFKIVLMSEFAPAIVSVMDFLTYAAKELRSTFGFLYGFLTTVSLKELIVNFVKGTAKSGGNPFAGAIAAAGGETVQSAFNKGVQDIASNDADYEQKVKEAKDRLNTKIAERHKRGGEDLGQIIPTTRSAIKSDALISVGNFLGSSKGGKAIEVIATKHLKVSEGMAIDMKKIAEGLARSYGFGVPSSTGAK